MNHVIANGVKQSRHYRLTSMEIYFSLSMYQAEIGSSILDELGNCHSLSENERKYSVNPVSLRGMKSRSNLSFWDCRACSERSEESPIAPRNDSGTRALLNIYKRIYREKGVKQG